MDPLSRLSSCDHRVSSAPGIERNHLIFRGSNLWTIRSDQLLHSTEGKGRSHPARLDKHTKKKRKLKVVGGSGSASQDLLFLLWSSFSCSAGSSSRKMAADTRARI